MSQLRESLNPGLETEQRNQQLHHHLIHVQPDVVSIAVDPPSSDEADGSNNEGHSHGRKNRPEGATGHDSDPPIENDNPDPADEGDELYNSDVFNQAILSSAERNRDIENAQRRAQAHHRKRKKSTHGPDVNYVPPYKKNRFFRRQPSVLPSKFLLGGNIRDPLNLASLSDARISEELNKVTPQSSPLPPHGIEVPVYIPKNPNDPLGLTTKTPENVEDMIAGISKNNCNRKHRHRKRPGRKRTDSECSIGTECTEADGNEEDEKIMPINEVNETQLENVQEIKTRENVQVVLSQIKDSSSSSRKRKRSASDPKQEDKAIEENTSQTTPAPVSSVVQNSTSSSTLETLVQSNQSKGNDEKVNIAGPGPDGKVDSSNSKVEPSPGPLFTDEGSRDVPYPSSSSDYIPMNSTYYAPSPFAFDSTEYFLEAPPYESPTFSPFMYTPTHNLQPFSPPPMPEIPHFQQRMQMFSARPQHLSLQRAIFHRPFTRKRTRHKADPIVSPVVPQPGCRRGKNHHHHHIYKKPGGTGSTKPTTTVGDVTDNAGGATEDLETNGKKYRPKDQIFQFGNYSHYYGYRTADQSDPRLWVLKKEYFDGKDVLDIGCNSGHVTLSIARDFEPRRIHGIDIDYSLIAAARKNIRHFLVRDPDNKDVVFPKSLPIVYGAIQPPPVAGEKSKRQFPYNVSFAHENYVLTSETLLENVKPEYNVITCFSVTKWIHLNFGDDGLKRFFRRVFLHLEDEGIFILEPQPWNSYTKKKKLTEKIHGTYQSIKFFPDQFQGFLTREVGFSTVESLGTPVHNSKGFQRPLLLFRKCKAQVVPVLPTNEDTIDVNDTLNTNHENDEISTIATSVVDSKVDTDNSSSPGLCTSSSSVQRYEPSADAQATNNNSPSSTCNVDSSTIDLDVDDESSEPDACVSSSSDPK